MDGEQAYRLNSTLIAVTALLFVVYLFFSYLANHLTPLSLFLGASAVIVCLIGILHFRRKRYRAVRSEASEVPKSKGDEEPAVL